MSRFTLPYGETSVSFEVDDARIIDVLHGKETPPVRDIPSALSDSLNAPIGMPALSEWVRPVDRIALIVSDLSRFWMRQDLVVPHLIHYLCDNCGVTASQITIVIACGTHDGGDEAELRRLVTSEVYDWVRVVNHDCQAADLVTMGTTAHGTLVRINRFVAEADKVIALGACTHHVMAGYGGGRKSILPGVSAMDTICHNHAYALDPKAFRSNPLIGNGITSGNPLNEDMCEAAALLPNLFVINLVMNADMKLAAIYAGDCLASWQTACRAVDHIYNVPIHEQADAVIVSCGGFPKDMSLYQGTKAIDNVEPGLKEGGTLIVLIEARDGGGPAEYFDWIGPLTDGTFEEKLRSHFTIPGYIFLLNCEQARRYRIMMLTSIPQEVVEPMGIEAYTDMDTLLRAAQLDHKRVYIIPNGSTVIPCLEDKQ